MGIHYTYKSQSGERSLRKQQKQAELSRRSEQRKLSRKQPELTTDVYEVPANDVVTLDLLTNPDLKR
jgi:hypothetical protein